MTFITENLKNTHQKDEFNCGKELLDNYLKFQANQDIKRRLSACFVTQSNQKITGYYTLSNSSVPLDHLPEHLKSKLPLSYLSIPVTLLGRLAVDAKFKGTGKGKLLLIDALKRSYLAAEEIGSFAVVVDPLDDDAFQFYNKFGFISLPDSKKMFLAMNIIRQLF